MCEFAPRPEVLKSPLNPTLLKPLRIIGWTMGRLDTIIDTNVSRHAHRLPEIAPVGPACSSSLSTRKMTEGLHAVSYLENSHSTDNRGHNNEGCTTEDTDQRDLTTQADIHRPQELVNVSKCSSWEFLGLLGSIFTGRGIESR